MTKHPIATGRHWAGRLAIAGLVVALTMGVSPAARAQYVEYYHAFGEWTVICALDEPTARTHCELRAPEPRLGGTGDAVRIDVVEPPAGETTVTIHLNLVVDAARGIALAIDGNPPHETVLARTGEAGWRGAAAAAILDEMARGRVLAVRFVRRGDGAVTERRFDLGGFPAARRTYLQRSAVAAGRR